MVMTKASRYRVVQVSDTHLTESPSFFLDCADWFLTEGQRARGLRVLSNLAESRYECVGGLAESADILMGGLQMLSLSGDQFVHRLRESLDHLIELMVNLQGVLQVDDALVDLVEVPGLEGELLL